MAAFHVAIRRLHILLAVTYFLGETHFIYGDNYNNTENNSRPSVRLPVPLPESKSRSNDNLVAGRSSIQSTSEDPKIVIERADHKVSITLDHGIHSISVPPRNSTPDTNSTNVQFIAPNKPNNYSHMVVTNTTPRSENSSVSTPVQNSQSTVVEMNTPSVSDIIHESNLTTQSYGFTSKKSINSTTGPNPDTITLQNNPTNNSAVTNTNISFDSENVSVSTSAPNTKISSVQMTTPSQSDPEWKVPIKNYTSTSEKSTTSTTLKTTPEGENSSVSAASPNAEVSNVEMTTSTEPFPVKSSNKMVENYSPTSERSSISTIDSTLSASTLQVNPTDNFDTANSNIKLGSKNPFVSRPKNLNPSVSTSAPSTDATTVQANIQTESIATDNFDATTIKYTAASEKISVSTSDSNVDTNTLRVTISSNPHETINPTSSNNILAKNSSSISPNPSPKYPEVDDSKNKLNITINSDGKTNQTLVPKNPTNNSDVSRISTSTEEISTIVKKQNCTSMLRSALIDSFTKVIIVLDAQLIDVFIDALNQSALQIYGQLHPSLLTKFISLIDESESIGVLVNNTLSKISDKKSLVLKAINEDKLLPGSNETILKIFKEIENLLKELNHTNFHNISLQNEVFFDITSSIKSTINDLLLSIREKAIADLYETTAIKNSLLRITAIVDVFLDNTQFYEHKFSPKSDLFSEMILDLIEEATSWKNDFMENFQYSWIDLLLRVEDEKKLFEKLSTNVSNVLENSQKKLQKSRINRLENTNIFKNLDQLEQSIRSQLSNFSDPVKTLFNESMEFSRDLLDELKNSFENGSDSATIYGATISIFASTMFNLQKEVPALLDINFFNGTISFDTPEMNDVFKSAAMNGFKLFNLCEGANNDQHERTDDDHHERHDSGENSTLTHNTSFSTSGGQFAYPFEYSLIFVLLVHYAMRNKFQN